ncbi:ABC transporter substrate-binding protein [Sinorhizobium medicae]|uniref:ABC transporter substrate-binding protein n=1 Tax=Sinorhizobium medicae TaxID=110321 RepID=A0ABX4THG6_9HYPH|nr:ABC transporter substrate-binding protein [Sinorhizobium medicae]MDX0457890.1 ABC transporter substrate-binding protein [Sinorhizobium medicae]PLT97781.1 ABC transporter substrate-binding protein [Sinorhizobium medicae]PLU16920.1 ABC transporter substrate-binding protein [Sinorhizobium medicae]PLU45458.1 ABC transporter substrate-binding protein [Sinorhizobium medicae]PLU80528.1 ABC transporter substrate-binding protein [Sinorhizobium medicae]
MKVFEQLAVCLFAACLLALGPTFALAEELPQLRAAMLASGTVNWEISTIKAHEFDRANGFELVVQDYADNGATRVAFEGGEAETMVADWIWVASQRAAGKDYVFIPYSRAVGGLMVKDDSDIKALPDLAGKKIGIAGGPLDKSWLILRAYAKQQHGMDLAAETEQVFGAPPLIFKSALSGETAGTINFWHFLAKMRAKGMHELISVSDAAAALKLDPDTPLLGYVLKGEYAATHPDIVKGLYKASRAAKDLLRSDDEVWGALRDKMNAADDAEFVALRDGYRAGIPSGKPIDEAAADRFLRLMAELGGEELVGKATSLPNGLFLHLE